MRAESDIMPVSPLSAGEPGAGANRSSASSPGQGFADVLLLGALACQTPVAVLSVPQPGGGWSTLSYGFEHRSGLNDGTLYEAIAAHPGPVEFTDMVTSLPRSPLVQTPHAMRWAYGMAIQDPDGGIVGVVAVMDRWLRQLTKREQRALLAMARQLSAMLGQLRRPVERSDSVPAIRPIAPPSAGRVQRAGSRGSAAAEAPQLLRSHEVATIFDVTERTVINWAAAGKLPSLRTIGGHLRFRRDDVMRLLSGSEELG
ncbi:MAG TPA: helix-turn-helix domain-containing protein [Acidimicrobiales bacterium]|nr:helix-turn-helix domain-containing protein [Acidimicrobiales bacterium]